MMNWYLAFYNYICMVLWLAIFFIFLFDKNAKDKEIINNIMFCVVSSQVFSCLEIIHALTGIVKTPLLPTFMQVGARLAHVYMIVNSVLFQHSEWFYGLIFIWGLAEFPRYAYYYFKVLDVNVPKFLHWYRYNAFFFLYPAGLSFELFLHSYYFEMFSMYHLLWASTCIAGFLYLYTHMVVRRAVMK